MRFNRLLLPPLAFRGRCRRRATTLASRFCSDFERGQLNELPERDREAAFLTLWTCKEAYLKAVGSGIAMPLRDIEVDFHPLRFVRINNDPHAAADWTLLHATLPEPAACTVAIRGPSRRLYVREFAWNRVSSTAAT